MKPLFGIDLTENSKNHQINGKEFEVAKASEENSEKRERIKLLTKILERNAKLPRALEVIKKIARIIAIIVVVSTLRILADSDGVSLKQAFENASFIFYIGIASLGLWGILELVERIKRKKIVNSGAAKVLEGYSEVENAIFSELGVPEGTKSTDILIFGYKMKDGEPVPKAAGANGIAFNNTRTMVYSDGANLCIVDVYRRFEIPLNSMRAIRTVNKRIALPGWKKDESFVSPAYKPYYITRNKYGVIFVKPYHILEFEIDGETWGLYFPCYELPTFEALTYITADK